VSKWNVYHSPGRLTFVRHVLSPFFFNFAFKYAIKRVQGKRGGLEIKWYTSTSGLCWCQYFGRKRAYYKKYGSFLVSSKETGLEVSADKSKHMVMSPDQNEVQNQNMKVHNKPFEKYNMSNIWEKL